MKKQYGQQHARGSIWLLMSHCCAPLTSQESDHTLWITMILRADKTNSVEVHST